MNTNINSDFDLTIASPGRINLIGEHVDYSGGFVLPAAIDKKIIMRFRKNDSDICSIYSKNFNSNFLIDLNNLNRSDREWQNYILGIIYHINILKPDSVKGFDLTIESNLPLGAGVSSSAALVCGVAKGLNKLFNIGLTDLEIITLSRNSEHTFVGTKCGIMDQFAVVMGKKNHLLLLNSETLEHQLIAADFGDYEILLLNTNVAHSLANSAYNTRRDECNYALESIQKKYPDFEYLAQVTPKIIKEFKKVLPENIYNRVLYVTKENRRTLRATKHLKKNNMVAFGKCLYKSHKGLQNKFEVSCKELDFLVDFTHNLGYIIGARMMGGGFGGCTINLVHKDKTTEFKAVISAAYQEKFNIQLTPFSVAISDGVSTI